MKLSPRQTEIAKLAAKGLKNREIADKLGIEYSTVKFQLHEIFRKLKIDRRAYLSKFY